MERFPCPYLRGEVELSKRRERHIALRHPELLPEYKELIVETVGGPDQVRLSMRSRNARLFSRWYPQLRGGKHVVVVVNTEPGAKERHWIVTAYIARKLAGGEIKWKKS